MDESGPPALSRAAKGAVTGRGVRSLRPVRRCRRDAGSPDRRGPAAGDRGMKATMQQAYPPIHNDTAESAVDALAKAWVSHEPGTAAAVLNARLGSATSHQGPE